MKNLTLYRLALVLFASTLLTGNPSLTPPATPNVVSQACEWTYYSDATYTTAVGGKFVNCIGVTESSWGVRTQYVQGVCESCL